MAEASLLVRKMIVRLSIDSHVANCHWRRVQRAHTANADAQKWHLTFITAHLLIAEYGIDN